LEFQSTGLILSYVEYLAHHLLGWKLATCKRGHMAMVPFDAHVGDVVAVLEGFEVPVLLRELAPEGGGDCRAQFVGTVYVHGLMNMDSEVRMRMETGAERFLLI